MILLIDNYDSFTFNLVHQIGALGYEVKVVRNDAITIEEIREMKPAAIVLSPGPGTPKEAGICIEVVQQLHTEFPVLGVCLGHQSIGEAFGADVIRANRIIHGKTSLLDYVDDGMFKGWTGDVEVMRYHSLVIDPPTLPDCLVVQAKSMDDGEIMAVRHKDYPVYGVQFHPESIGTERGNEMVGQFLKTVL